MKTINIFSYTICKSTKKSKAGQKNQQTARIKKGIQKHVQLLKQQQKKTKKCKMNSKNMKMDRCIIEHYKNTFIAFK